jgi:hypothetical protein
MEITAITNSTWIIPPKLYPKNPTAQRMTNTTAMRYRRFPMILILSFFEEFIFGTVMHLFGVMNKCGRKRFWEFGFRL